LAGLAQKQSQFDRAIGFYTQALSIFRERVGELHVDFRADVQRHGSALYAHGESERSSAAVRGRVARLHGALWQRSTRMLRWQR
jgi:hypothetical protein